MVFQGNTVFALSRQAVNRGRKAGVMSITFKEWVRVHPFKTERQRLVQIIFATAEGRDPVNVAKACRRQRQFIEQYPEYRKTFIRMGSSLHRMFADDEDETTAKRRLDRELGAVLIPEDW